MLCKHLSLILEQVMKWQEFSWHDHAVAFLQKYLPAVAEPLDDQFAVIYELTYDRLGMQRKKKRRRRKRKNGNASDSVGHDDDDDDDNSGSDSDSDSDEDSVNGHNTEKFRRAVWFYAQSLLGVRNDDYDYGDVNEQLQRQMKGFIRKVGRCLLMLSMMMMMMIMTIILSVEIFDCRWLFFSCFHCPLTTLPNFMKENFRHNIIIVFCMPQVVFWPYEVTLEDVQAEMTVKDEETDRLTALADSEKCHVVLLAANARAQACLMYAVRAVLKHVS